MGGLGEAIDAASMVCGPDVEERPVSSAELELVLQKTLAAYRAGAYGVHSAICSARQLQELERRVRIPDDFHRQALAHGKMLISLLAVPLYGESA